MKNFLVVFLVILSATIIYWPGFSGTFIYDDVQQIANNTKLQNAKSIGDLLSVGDRQSRLLQNFSFWVDYRLGNGKVVAFKVTNLLLHISVSLLIFFWLIKLLPNQFFLCFSTVILFAVHPLQVEAVTYIMGRISLLVGLIFLIPLTLNAYSRKWGEKGLPLFSGLAILTKSTALLLPGVFTAYVFLIESKSIKTILKNKWIWAGFGTALLFVPFFNRFREGNFSSGVGFGLYPYSDYIFAQFNYYFVYLKSFVWPTRMSLIHPFPKVDGIILFNAFLGGLFILSILSLFVYWVRQKGREQIVGAFIIFLAFTHIAPTNSFVPMKNIYAEYRIYLSNLLVCYLVSFGLWKLHEVGKKKVAWGLIASLVFYFGAHTMSWTSVWGQGYAIYSKPYDHYPNDPTTQSFAAFYLLDKGEIEASNRLYEEAFANIKAQEHTTAYLCIETGLAKSRSMLGDHASALKVLNEVNLTRYFASCNAMEYFVYKLLLEKRLNKVESAKSTLILSQQYLSMQEQAKLGAILKAR